MKYRFIYQKSLSEDQIYLSLIDNIWQLIFPLSIFFAIPFWVHCHTLLMVKLMHLKEILLLNFVSKLFVIAVEVFFYLMYFTEHILLFVLL